MRTIFWMEREAITIFLCWTLSKKHRVPFLTSLVWRDRGLNPQPPDYGAKALTTEPPLRLITMNDICHGLIPIVVIVGLVVNSFTNCVWVLVPSQNLCPVSFISLRIRHFIKYWCAGIFDKTLIFDFVIIMQYKSVLHNIRRRLYVSQLFC